MNLNDIAKIRLASQQIAGTKLKTAKDIVNWMGAMQAQDFNMAKWAIGVRLPGSTEKIIEDAINKGEIIRTHLLRPTWHFVSPEDIYWMIDLTAPQIKSAIKSRNKELELTEEVFKKTYKIIERALSNSNHLTREELIVELKKSKIETGDNRASHIFLRSEIDKLICSGAAKGNKQTYTLFENKVTETKTLKRDEAITKLAGKYFASHSPATLEDFVWWSGLTVKDSKLALETIKSNFVSETIGKQIFWFTNPFFIPKLAKDSVYVLPAFDEFIISYKDRTASLPFENHKNTVSNNGIFRPVIVINGQVSGIWKRTIKKNEVIVEIELFNLNNRAKKKLMDEALEKFGQFLDKEITAVPKSK